MSPHSMLSSAACQLARQQLSPAMAFVQCCRRAFSTSWSSSIYSATSASSPAGNHSLQTIPEFLLPYRRNRIQFSSSRLPPFPSRRQRFASSSTASNRGAKVIQNPRVDDDGNPLWIHITPRAAAVREFISFWLYCLIVPCRESPLPWHLRSDAA